VSLLPREVSFAEEVADYFLSLKGSGVALSALDVELVLAWQKRKLPFGIVCRGIRKTAEQRARGARPGDDPLRTLRSCAREVEDEFRRSLGLGPLSLSAPLPSPKARVEAGVDRLTQARLVLRRTLKAAKGPLKQALTQVLAHAESRPESPQVAATAVARLDEALALCYLRALPGPERRAILKGVRRGLGRSLAQMSQRARKASLRAHRVLAAKAHGGLPELR
jgi:hypothetical protein